MTSVLKALWTNSKFDLSQLCDASVVSSGALGAADGLTIRVNDQGVMYSSSANGFCSFVRTTTDLTLCEPTTRLITKRDESSDICFASSAIAKQCRKTYTGLSSNRLETPRVKVTEALVSYLHGSTCHASRHVRKGALYEEGILYLDKLNELPRYSGKTPLAVVLRSEASKLSVEGAYAAMLERMDVRALVNCSLTPTRVVVDGYIPNMFILNNGGNAALKPDSLIGGLYNVKDVTMSSTAHVIPSLCNPFELETVTTTGTPIDLDTESTEDTGTSLEVAQGNGETIFLEAFRSTDSGVEYDVLNVETPQLDRAHKRSETATTETPPITIPEDEWSTGATVGVSLAISAVACLTLYGVVAFCSRTKEPSVSSSFESMEGRDDGFAEIEQQLQLSGPAIPGNPGLSSAYFTT